VLVLAGRVPLQALWVSLPVTLLVSNLLLVNQLPDIDADRADGRRHIAIAWGTGSAAWVSALLLGGCYLSIFVGWVSGILPASSLWVGITLPGAIYVVMSVWQFDSLALNRLIRAMATNVLLTLLVPVLLAIGMLMA